MMFQIFTSKWILRKSALRCTDLRSTETAWVGVLYLPCFYLLGVLFSGMTGCQAKPSVAPRSQVLAEPLRTFPRESIRLTSNRLFLWPESYDDELVSEVLRLSKSMDDLENESISWNQKKAEIIQRVEKIQESKRSKKKELNRKWSDLNLQVKDRNLKRNLKRDQLMNELDEKRKLEAQEKAKDSPDVTLLEQLSLEIQQCETQLTDLEKEHEKEVASIRTEQKQIDDELKKLNQSQSSEETRMIQQKDEILSHCKEIDGLGIDLVGKVENLVKLFDTQGTVIAFRFDEEGGVQVSITDWTLDPKEGKRSFSSQSESESPPSIRNVSYDERGGVFEFEVWVDDLDGLQNPREVFTFKLERTHYHAQDRRVYLSGEITRKRFRPDGEVEIRTGVAKLIDSSN